MKNSELCELEKLVKRLVDDCLSHETTRFNINNTNYISRSTYVYSKRLLFHPNFLYSSGDKKAVKEYFQAVVSILEFGDEGISFIQAKTKNSSCIAITIK